VQRAAVEAFVTDKPDVDYFPSYETVTLTNPDVCWARNDYRHISPDIVARIMSNVLVSYIPDFEATGAYHGRPMTEDAILATARMLAKLSEGPELAALFAQNRQILRSDEKLLARIADVLQHADLPEAEADVLDEMVALAPQRPRLLQRLISAVVRIPDSAERTRALLALHGERFPTRADFRARVERSLDSLEDQP